MKVSSAGSGTKPRPQTHYGVVGARKSHLAATFFVIYHFFLSQLETVHFETFYKRLKKKSWTRKKYRNSIPAFKK